MTSLLPPNATPLALALESVLSPALDAIEASAGAKLDAIPPFVPWLIWEYGLGELMPYLPDPRRAIRDGLAWQRVRGTPRALTTALGWRGFAGAAIEEAGPGRRFAWFQLDPHSLPTPAAVADIVGLARLAAPARSRLIRIHHGLDRRPFHLSRDALSGGAILSGWSGIWDKELEIWLSLGERHGAAADAPAIDVAPGIEVTRSVVVTVPRGGFRLSDSSLSRTPFQRPVDTGRTEDANTTTPASGLDFVGGRVGLWQTPRSHVQLSGTRFGSADHRFGGHTTESRPFRLSDSGLSRTRSELRRRPILEVSAVTVATAATLETTPTVAAGHDLVIGTATPRSRSYPRLSGPPPISTTMAAAVMADASGSDTDYSDALWTDAPWSDAPWPIDPVTVGAAAWQS